MQSRWCVFGELTRERQGQVTTLAWQVRAAGKHQSGHAASTCEAEGAVEQAIILCVNQASLEPNASNFKVLLQLTFFKR
jgi:hypothetical protein